VSIKREANSLAPSHGYWVTSRKVGDRVGIHRDKRAKSALATRVHIGVRRCDHAHTVGPYRRASQERVESAKNVWSRSEPVPSRPRVDLLQFHAIASDLRLIVDSSERVQTTVLVLRHEVSGPRQHGFPESRQGHEGPDGVLRVVPEAACHLCPRKATARPWRSVLAAGSVRAMALPCPSPELFRGIAN